MNTTLKVLLIEDDAIEVMKFNRVLSKLKSSHQIENANNGEEAFKILASKQSLPDIILLDLNMPKMNGIEFLTVLKKNESLRHIPIIILSTSQNEKDLLACYKIGVSGYVLKPLKYEDYVTKIHKLLAYWEINQLI